MKKVHAFYSDLYKENFIFLPAFTQKQVDVFTNKHKIEPIDIEGCEGRTVFCDNFVLIWSRYKDKSFDSISTLVHECVHASWMVLDYKGIPIKLENDDTQAYFIEWIFENCYRALK